MQHVLHWSVDVDVLGDVVADELKIERAQVSDIVQITGNEIVDTDDGISASEKRFAEMGSDEAGCAGDDDACHGAGQARWNRPRTRVSHMIFRSSVTDQFSM